RGEEREKREEREEERREERSAVCKKNGCRVGKKGRRRAPASGGRHTRRVKVVVMQCVGRCVVRM
ncbi:MAG: hypothetical protein K2G82_03390, partial [Paramuribaculum sp.]|nr:hypothetical protein [Paramuribaculum sp.]